MGNQLLKGYTIQGEPISGVGCEKIWRIYQGHKQNTNTQATIFALQKKALPRNQRQEILQFAKREAMSLARIRHPGVLAISEALIEDEQIMAFSTQQVLGNLTTLAKQNRLKQIISNEIELRLNLFPLLDTIQFLHENVKTVHLGINFDNIYITKQGKWKISGFSNSQIHSGEGLEDIKNFRCSNYYFCSPEVALQKKFQKKSDVYSFGILILDLMLVLSNKFQLKSYRNESQYSQGFESDLLKKINSESLEKIETYKELKLLLKNVFTRDPQKRTNLHQLSSSKWLNDKLVLTVRYLQNITNYDNKQQVQFLKGLLGVLNHFEPKILLRKVLPLLLDLLKFKHLIPSVVYICLETMKNGKIITQQDFREKVWPSFKKVVQGKQMTAHSLYLFVDNMQKIEKVVGLQQLTQTVIPLYVKCFDCPTKLKELALYKTDYILSKMDYQFVKTKMIPKVMGCIKDQNPEVHKKSLIALKKSIKILDTQTITSIVLPGLQACKKSGSDPFINAITVAIYTVLGKTLPSQTLCSKLIPTILPFLSDPNVGPQDFYNYKNALLTMMDKIESERKKFWDDSQLTQGPGFTEKDFQFEDESKKSAQTQSNIGKGDYNFLSNYNNNPQKQETPAEQPDPNKKQIELNFSSPWNFDQPSKAQSPPQQPTVKVSPSISSPKIQANFQPKQHVGATNFTAEPRLPSSLHTPGLGMLNQQSWGTKTQPNYNFESKQGFPKLKGPGVKKNQMMQEPVVDPWASLQTAEKAFPNPKIDFYSSNSANNTWEFSSSNTGPSIKTPSLSTFNNNNGSNMFGSEDPFADIQKGNSGLTSNFNNGSQSLYGIPSNTYSSPGTGYGNINQNLGVNSFNGFGFSQSQSGTSQFSLGGGSGMGSSAKKATQPGSSANSFDLI